MLEVGRVELSGRLGVRYNPLQAVLCLVPTDAQQAMGRIDIVGFHIQQVLTPERCIIGQRKHQTVTQRFAFNRLQERLPLLFTGDPGELPMAAKQWALTYLSTPSFRQITATDRIVQSQPLYDQMVIEQTDDCQSQP